MTQPASILKNKVALAVVAVLGVCLVSACCIVIFIIAFGNKNSSSDGSTGSTTSKKKLSISECQSNAAKFDKKVLKISGNGIQGTVALTANVSECRIEAQYHLLFPAGLPQNPYNSYFNQYNYIALIHKTSERERQNSYGIGVIFAAYRNKALLPIDSFASMLNGFYAEGAEANQLGATETFYAIPERWFELSDKGYADMLSDTVFELIDSKPYIIEEKIGNASTYTTDTAKAEKQGTIVKTYNWQYQE
ncbi:MAG: hypothetical protein WCJ58_00250 [bacterium]